MDAAVRRGAPVLAELVGFGASTDAHHLTAPLPSGASAAAAISTALRMAGRDGAAVDYVNAHASGTELNEPAEARALHLALGERAASVPVSGTKGLYGHALGASGAVEAAITALALHEGTLPGTCNLQRPDPTIDLHLLRDPVRSRAKLALSTSFGFGGMNAALLLAAAD
jgi:3-oxoacyl-(acyl-carrier-protein) synthase